MQWCLARCCTLGPSQAAKTPNTRHGVLRQALRQMVRKSQGQDQGARERRGSARGGCLLKMKAEHPRVRRHPRHPLLRRCCERFGCEGRRSPGRRRPRHPDWTPSGPDQGSGVLLPGVLCQYTKPMSAVGNLLRAAATARCMHALSHARSERSPRAMPRRLCATSPPDHAPASSGIPNVSSWPLAAAAAAGSTEVGRARATCGVPPPPAARPTPPAAPCPPPCGSRRRSVPPCAPAPL